VDNGETWAGFFDAVKLLVDKLGLPADRKLLLQEAAGRVNSMPHKAVMESILTRMMLVVSDRRTLPGDAATTKPHGRPAKTPWPATGHGLPGRKKAA
jgi:hypothetical protein